jgi:hypothetical protein
VPENLAYLIGPVPSAPPILLGKRL